MLTADIRFKVLGGVTQPARPGAQRLGEMATERSQELSRGHRALITHSQHSNDTGSTRAIYSPRSSTERGGGLQPSRVRRRECRIISRVSIHCTHVCTCVQLWLSNNSLPLAIGLPLRGAHRGNERQIDDECECAVRAGERVAIVCAHLSLRLSYRTRDNKQ